MKIGNLSKTDWYFYLVVFIAFYLLNRYSYLGGDDYWYSFISDGNGNLKPINSLQDAIASQIGDYMTHSGRFVVHTLVCYFCGVLGMGIFKILNSIIFVCLNIGILKLIRREFGSQSADKYLILFLLFVCIPYPGQTLLSSIAMCINYLWTACAVVYFMLLYDKVKNGEVVDKLYLRILLFFTALVIGSLQESFTIGISGALFVYYCFHIKEFKGNIGWLVVGFWIGTVIAVLAPGNYVRIETDPQESNAIFTMTRFIKYLLVDAHLLSALLLILTTVLLKNKKKYKDFLQKNIVYILTVAFNLVVVFLICTGERQFFCIALFASIILLKLLYGYWNVFVTKYRLAIKTILCVILLAIYVPVYGYRKACHDSYQELYTAMVYNHILINESNIQTLRELNKEYLSRRYTFQNKFEEDWIYTGFSLIKTNGADLFFVKAILPDSPDRIVDDFNIHNKNGIYHNKEKNYYIIGEETAKSLKKCKALSGPTTIFGKLRNKVLGINNLYKMDVTSLLRPFEYQGQLYYIFHEPDYEVFDLLVE